ncbi:MAG TPA: diacylglycerol kinase family protein [Gemmatimonadales bacterium]|nr:diacylglycerol kinase family protein [Gemmatimonadales bacterium]
MNAGSGRGVAAETARHIETVLAAGGRPSRITLARHGRDIRPGAERAVKQGTAGLIAAGGDGTVNTLAGVAVGAGVPLGVLPQGTLNHFAKDLGIPTDLDGALGVILAGQTTRVDVGEVSGRIFVNNSSLGVYPRIVRLRERYGARGPAKWVAALWATLAVLRRHPFAAVRLVVNGEPLLRRTPFVFVGNNEYRMEGLRAGTRDALDRGVLAVYVMNASGRRSLAWLGFQILLGRTERLRELDTFLLDEATIELKHSTVGVALDGEVAELRPPLVYRSRPGALQVFAPPARQSPPD